MNPKYLKFLRNMNIMLMNRIFERILLTFLDLSLIQFLQLERGTKMVKMRYLLLWVINSLKERRSMEILMNYMDLVML